MQGKTTMTQLGGHLTLVLVWEASSSDIRFYTCRFLAKANSEHGVVDVISCGLAWLRHWKVMSLGVYRTIIVSVCIFPKVS
ncbi:hypothetical protein B9Z19DRAFT_1088154 [Tuber borchii]|uniref:Uncharacterized protein n=1 Tax=Tuber borchii TaxID=42251 RepID=A0A2T6ZLZ2_TUBBO|nr:hypothetical protein B9Z19DRAFT_1088154 [Tuber borchii]